MLLITSIASVNAKLIKGKTVGIMNSGNTIYVDDDNIEGPWDGTIEHPYQFIQDSVNVADKGDTIFVFRGTYIVYPMTMKL